MGAAPARASPLHARPAPDLPGPAPRPARCPTPDLPAAPPRDRSSPTSGFSWLGGWSSFFSVACAP